jgi:hypothetical protein
MAAFRDERAQVLVETAIAFPVQIVITLAIMQYALLAGAKQTLVAATHAAARAALVGLDPHRAASIVLSPIAGPTHPAGTAAPIFIPGVGFLKHSSQAQLKTTVDLTSPPDDGDKLVSARVTFDYEFPIPFVEYTPFQNWHLLWGDIIRIGPRGVVHKVMTQTVSLPQPWDGDDKNVTGHLIIPDLGAQPEE